MRDQIVVTGGTGLLGRAAVQRLLDAGREVRVLSRRHRPAHERAGYAWATADIGSGHGVREASTGAGVIVHCATAFGRRAEGRVVEDLVRAARRVGSPHLVYIFIVGGRPRTARVPPGKAGGGAFGAAQRPAVNDPAEHTRADLRRWSYRGRRS